jgi:hypothetical protein
MEPTVISSDPVDAGGFLAASGVYSGLLIVFLVIAIVGLYRIFEKADEPGWAAIIPIYNYYVILKITGRPWWWLILLLIPVVGTITWFVMLYNLAKAFGKGALFALGLIVFPAIFLIVLGFGSASYQGYPSRLQTGDAGAPGPFAPGPGDH